jgi:hypothetical protein
MLRIPHCFLAKFSIRGTSVNCHCRQRECDDRIAQLRAELAVAASSYDQVPACCGFL